MWAGLTTSIKVTYICTIGSIGLMTYYMMNPNQFSPSAEETEKLKKYGSQVSFRDPKLIEEHKKKLADINAKKKNVEQ